MVIHDCIYIYIYIHIYACTYICTGTIMYIKLFNHFFLGLLLYIYICTIYICILYTNHQGESVLPCCAMSSLACALGSSGAGPAVAAAAPWAWRRRGRIGCCSSGRMGRSKRRKARPGHRDGGFFAG